MGRMVDGTWQVEEAGTPNAGGRFQRPETRFRDTIAPGTRFAPEAGRYHLYVSLACPWAHRTLIFRHLKGLEEVISLSVTHWHMGAQGWNFAPGEGVLPDTVNGAEVLHQVYAKADPHFSGRVTVPVLWDKATGSIVNNESAEIIRILNSAFDGIGAAPGDWYPAPLRAEIDAVNERVYATLNNGVYRAGFARTQEAYEEAVVPLFATLDWLEERLSRQPFLCGEAATEADWRLFTTLIRFDAVYHGHYQVQPAADPGLPGAVGLHPVALPAPGHRGDGRSRPYQAALLWQPRLGEPERRGAPRPGAGSGPARQPPGRAAGLTAPAPRQRADIARHAAASEPPAATAVGPS
ncbi:glutathione S-transferase family protein [Paracraurococcus lichenis]|uniref:glutathione S-transferase family protein n=1 Tax=Paracraurococcus lichenis TaxID=3064888 RepID=UPI00351D8CE9